MRSASVTATSAQGATALTRMAERVAAGTADIVADARELGASDGSTVPVGCERGAPTHSRTSLTRAAVVNAESDGSLDTARETGHDAGILPS